MTQDNGSPRWQLRDIVAYDGWGGTSPEAHFGLGQSTVVDSVLVRWPSGRITERHNVPAHQVLTFSVQPPDLAIAPAGGFSSSAVEVHLISQVQGGEVQYTLDGSEPTSESSLYSEPFNLTPSRLIRARVFKDGVPASDPVSALFLEPYWNDGVPPA